MKAKLLIGAAALVLLAVPAAAQNNASKTIDPIVLSKQMKKKPPLQLNDEQRKAIQNGLVAVHTQQKTPKGFKPQVGAALPKGIKTDGMPQGVIRAQPSLKDYGYAKTASDILVIDPMTQKIAAVVPRKFPADANAATSPTPAQWWDSHARELTGQAPQDANADKTMGGK